MREGVEVWAGTALLRLGRQDWVNRVTLDSDPHRV